MLLCQPPLVHNKQMVTSFERKPPLRVYDHSALLGFKCMVAPTNQTASEGHPQFHNTPIPRDVQELLGRVNATSKVAPDLHMVIREGLQSKQVQTEATETYLGGLKSLQRYNKPFKMFWAFCKEKGINTLSATLSELAGFILQFDKILPSQSRFAYAGLILIPGLEQLSFNPILRQLKRKWNISEARYVTFYDASNPVKKLANCEFHWNSMEQVRLQLILCCRFLMLCRNVDLARMYRTVSLVGGKPFVLIQRNGWTKPKWESMTVFN